MTFCCGDWEAFTSPLFFFWGEEVVSAVWPVDFLVVSDTLLKRGSLDVDADGPDLSSVGIMRGGIVADLVVKFPVRRRSLAFILPPRFPEPS